MHVVLNFVAAEKYMDTGKRCSELVVFKTVLKKELYLKNIHFREKS